jgi:death on curing protein
VFFLSLRHVLQAYAGAMGCSVAEATDQLRDRGGLESALARPRHYAAYQDEPDLALLAAVLAHGIAAGQKFIEGNKRTALVALDLFLRLNGYTISTSQKERAAWMIGLSAGQTIDDLASAIRASLVTVTSDE